MRARIEPSENVVVSSDNAAGIASAAAKPCSVRAVRSTPGPGAKPPSNEARPSSPIPDTKSLHRPNRSPSRPNRRVKPAAGSANAAMTQGSPVKPNPMPLPTRGRAMFRIVRSMANINPAPIRTSRINRCLPSRCGAEVVSVVTRRFPSIGPRLGGFQRCWFRHRPVHAAAPLACTYRPGHANSSVRAAPASPSSSVRAEQVRIREASVTEPHLASAA